MFLSYSNNIRVDDICFCVLQVIDINGETGGVSFLLDSGETLRLDISKICDKTAVQAANMHNKVMDGDDDTEEIAVSE